MKFLSSLIAMFFLLSPAFANEGWETDFAKAKKLASESNKDILVEFTGSDWCKPCKMLEAEVFKKESFQGAESFILVSLDFPSNDSKISEALKTQNTELQRRYRVSGFPTVLLMDSNGLPYAKTGYRKGGVEAYNEHLAELKKQKAVRDEAFSKAEKATDAAEKAALLTAGFSAMPNVNPQIFPKELAALAKCNPDSRIAEKALAGPETAEQRMARLKKEVAENKLKGLELQQALWAIDRKATYETLEEEIEAIDRAIEAWPRSRLANSLRTAKEDLSRLQQEGGFIDGWQWDLDQAMVKAKEQGKDLLIGIGPSSDRGSEQLRDKVFAKPNFDSNERFVHVWLDIPAAGRFSKNAKFSNYSEMLAAARTRYHAFMYPVVLVADQDGVPYGRILEFNRGAEKIREVNSYNHKLDQIYQRKAQRDAAFAKAESLEGKAKVQPLLAGFDVMPDVQPWHYPSQLDELRNLLPEDSWFFQLRSVDRNQRGWAEKKLSVERLQKKIEQQNLRGEDLQITMIAIHGMLRHETPADELANWEKIIAIAPESRHAKLAKPELARLRKKAENPPALQGK